MTIVYLGAFALQAVLATLMWVATPRQPVRRPVVAIMVFGGLWALADLLSNLAATAAEVRLLTYLSAFAWALVPYFILRAALAYGGHRRLLGSVPASCALLAPAAVLCWLVWTDRMFSQYLPAGAEAPHYHAVATSWQLTSVVTFVGYLLAAALVLLHAARRSGRRELRRVIRLVVWVVVPGTLVGLAFNAGLFFFEAITPWVGSVVVAVSSLFLAVGMLRRDFLVPLHEVEQDYRALLETSPDGIAITDLEGRFVMVNQRAVEIVGYDSVDAFLSEHRSASELLAPEDLPSAVAVIRRVAREGKVARFEYRVCRRDGSTLPVEASVGLLRGNDGEARGLISIMRDLTERKEAESERRRLEAQIEHAQKLESMGILAGGIAHDFNNLLVGVLGNASLAKQEVSVGSVTWDRVHQIEVAAQRAAGLTREMLAYSGRGKFVIEPLDLSNLVGEITRLLEVSISKKIDVTYEFCPDLPAVRGDASQLQQVIMNLITNASEAIGDHPGSIALATRHVEVHDGELTDSGSGDPVPAGPYVSLCVRDTGVGMDTDTQRRIFDPFFTTKFTGRGLGLAAVQGIVRGHEGAILVDSEPGRGSHIDVLLPCAPEKPVGVSRRLTPIPLSSQQWTGSGVVLVVDDEELVRQVATLALERVGFSVLAARDGEEGVRMFTARASEVVAVVLDLTMPKMDGREALGRMRAVRENVPVIITSGYTEEEASARFDDDATVFVQKPFSPIELVGAVRSSLDSSDALG